MSGDEASRKSANAERAALSAGVDRSMGKKWLDSAKAGRQGEMEALLQQNRNLLTYQGQGTSYGFVGHTALHWCAAKGHIQPLQWLLRQGAPPSAGNLAGSTPLHSAAANGQEEALRQLALYGGANMGAVDEFDEDARTVASKHNQPGAVAVLDMCRLAAHLKCQDPEGWTLLDARSLLQQATGAHTEGFEQADVIRMCQEYLATVFSPPALAGAPVAAAAPATPPPSGAGKPRRKLTAEQEARRAAMFKRDDEAMAREATDEAAAKAARAQKDAEAERTARAAGAGSRAEGKQWLEAAKSGDVATLGKLLAARPTLMGYQGEGTNLGFSGHGALHWAASRGQVGALRWLIAHGADVGAKNEGGSTALHVAAQMEQAESAKCLVVEGGADPSARDDFGESPLDVASARRCTAVAMACQMGGRIAALREQEDGTWGVKLMREALQLAGVDTRDCVEKGDFTAKVRELLASLPAPAVKGASPKPTPVPKPAPEPTRAPAVVPAPAPAPTPTGDGGGDGAGKPRRKLTAEQEARRAAMFKRDDEAMAREATDEAAAKAARAQKDAEAERTARAAGAGSRAEGKQWLEAAKSGDVATLGKLLAARPTLMGYQGEGTNLGFSGHGALHWAASRGQVGALRWLIAHGADVGAKNEGGSTALHVAAQMEQAESAKCLVVEGGADPSARDDFGESPLDVASARRCTAVAMACQMGGRIAALREQEDGTWGVKLMREALQLAGVNTRDCVEKGDFTAKVRELLASLPAPAAKSSTPAAPKPTRAPAPAPTQTTPPAGGWRGDGGSSDSDGEGGGSGASDQERSEQAKARGNEAFKAKDYPRALKHYSMAARLDPGNHVLWSNRSGTHAAMGHWEEALQDAERCVGLQPSWAKGYGRKATALVGMGQAGEAVKAYLRGLEVEPENAALREGLLEAKRVIQDHRRRYEEQWGPNGPSSAMGGEGGKAEEGVPRAQRKPWFECPCCDNRTRDEAVTPCCGEKVCGTCLKRGGGSGSSCPLSCSKGV